MYAPYNYSLVDKILTAQIIYRKMGRNMKIFRKNVMVVIVLLLYLAVSVLDIFNNGNGFLQLILALLSSFIVFYMPLFHLNQKN